MEFSQYRYGVIVFYLADTQDSYYILWLISQVIVNLANYNLNNT